MASRPSPFKDSPRVAASPLQKSGWRRLSRMLWPLLLAAPTLLAQTYQLEAFGHTPDTLVTGDVTSKSGVVRSPAGTAVTPDGLTTSHPAGSVITVTNPGVSRFGTPLPFLGWAPTEYDPVTGYAAAVTTNPISITLNANRRLIGYAGYPVAEAINTPGRTWTSGGHALWTGTYDVFAPEAGGGGGVARATILREVGDEAWLESSFVAPTILSYTWRLDLPTGEGARLEALVDGVVTDTFAPAANSWQVRTLDLAGSGPVKVRFRLTQTAISTIPILVNRRGSAYLTHVRTGDFAAPARVVVSNTSATSATLTWQAAYGAESYTVELAGYPGFSQILFTQDIAAPTVSASFWALTSGATYHYRVRSRRTGHPPLASVAGSFVAVTRSAQTIAFPAIPDQTLGSAFALGATASSGLPVEYTVVDGPAHVDAEGLLHFTGTGTVIVRAEQLGDHAFEPASAVTRAVSVSAPTSAKVSLAATTRTYTGQPQTVTATTTPPGLHVTYRYQLGKAAPSEVPPTEAGTYAVTATLDLPGLTVAPAKATLKILKAPLTVTGDSAERLVGQANPPLSLVYSGFLGDDGVNDLDSLPTPVTSARPNSPVGRYPVTFTGGQDNNYDFVPGSPPGELEVRGFGTAFEALVLDADLLSTGKLALTPSKNSLTYTGSLLLAAEAKAIPLPPGRLLQPSVDLTTATDTVVLNLPATRDVPARSYRLSFTLNAEAGSLEGSLQLDNQPYATLAHGRLLEIAAPRTSTGLKGAYTLLLPPATPAAPASPEGAGYAIGTITDAGQLSLAGKLADGTPFTASALHDQDKAYRLFVKPHGKRLGQRFGGHLPLVASTDFSTAPSPRHRVAAAPWVWSKPGLLSDKSYRSGFGPVITQANLELWLPPAARIPARGSAPEVPALTLAQRLGLAPSPTAEGPFELDYQSGSLTELQRSAPPALLSLQASGAVLPPVPNATGFKLKLNPKTGAFTGEFTVAETLVAPATKPVTRKAGFAGVFRQGPGADSELIGQGHFILPALRGAASTESTSGAVSFFVPEAAP